MTLGDIISDYRNRHQLTMDDFSKMANISKAYVSMLEKNKNSSNGKPIIPSLPTLKKVAMAINISIDELLNLLDGDQPIFIPKDGDSTLLCKEENTLSIGDRIKQRRKELDLSVDDIAKKLGKNRATVYRYESDDIENLSITILEPLAKILQTTPADLMGWNADEKTKKLTNKQQESAINAGFMIITDKAEQAIIKKYRALNERSKKSVDEILDNYFELSQPAAKDEVG